MRTALITLGRYGDQLITLPIAYAEYLSGNKVTMVIDSNYTDLMDGVTYCDHLEWHGGFHRPLDAAKWCEGMKQFDRILIAQAYGTQHDILTSSFADEMWRLCGYGDKIGKFPLVFDNRNSEREKNLLLRVAGSGSGKPKVIVSTKGLSSPFAHRERLFSMLASLREKYDFIDLDAFRAEKFFDVLALYENSVALIATDSGPLHLANAVPGLDVIAIVTDSPNTWHGSPSKPNHRIRIRYSEFNKRANEIVDYLAEGAVFRASDYQGKTTFITPPSIWHVWNYYSPRTADAERRHQVAKASWEREYKSGSWVKLPIRTKDLPRSGKAVGAHKDVPYVNDMIDYAADLAAMNDLICLTNDDTIFVTNLIGMIKPDSLFWGSRYEHQRVNGPLDSVTIRRNAYKHVGADIFVFSKKWWMENRSRLPDFLISYEAWDLCLRTLLDKTSGGPMDGLVAHIIHQPDWHSAQYRESKGNLFNRESARRFFRQENMSWPQV